MLGEALEQEMKIEMMVFYSGSLRVIILTEETNIE
jgi:hypothetical protein